MAPRVASKLASLQIVEVASMSDSPHAERLLEKRCLEWQRTAR
jgi:hypothetical protein